MLHLVVLIYLKNKKHFSLSLLSFVYYNEFNDDQENIKEKKTNAILFNI